MRAPQLTVFANFYIDTEERLLRLKDSFRSISQIDVAGFVVNVRGRYSKEAAYFIAEKDNNVKFFFLESEQGWFYDTSMLIKYIETGYVLLWVEDHICMRPDKVNAVVDDMVNNAIDILTYSWWCDGEMKNRYSNVVQVDDCEITHFDHTIANNKDVQNNKYGIRSYIISYASIISRALFVKIVLDSGSESRWDKMLPFDFEKAPYDIKWLPLRRGVPKYELFASIDDDLHSSDCCLQSRGLYPMREPRKSYTVGNRNFFRYVKDKLKLSKIADKIRCAALIHKVPSEYRMDFIRSSFVSGSKGFEDIPWMNYYVIQFIKSRMDDIEHVFEYGSGQSTIFWINNGKHVVSIEHDKEFFEGLHDVVADSALCRYLLREPEINEDNVSMDDGGVDMYSSSRYKGYNFRSYSQSIREYDDHTFDVVVVDGRARSSCIRESMTKLKEGGMLVLDNSSRESYKEVQESMLFDWVKYEFIGPVRGLEYVEKTTVYIRP